MVGRRLPFVEEVMVLPEDEKKLRVSAELLQTFGTNGWQVVLDLHRDVVKNALRELSKGDTPEFNAGMISAVEQVRECLRDLTSDNDVDADDEELMP